MKKRFILPAIIILAGLFSFKGTDNPIKYSSPEGHFSVVFPGKPNESVEDDTTASGSPMKIHFATFEANNDEVYMSGWIDMHSFYPENSELKKILENSRDGATKSMNATKVTTLTTNLGVNPYIEFIFESDQFIGKDRIYMINKTQYSIITIFSPKKGIQPAADKFISSFQYLK